MAEEKFFSFEGEVRLNAAGRPINPRKKTGIEGKGELWHWGANFAVDAIVTRINPENNRLEMVAIRRKDTGQLAIPGGMIEAGEDHITARERELYEETGLKLDLSDAEEIYRGYCNDPRNTDNAWIETFVSHKHLGRVLDEDVELRAGDDAKEAQWLLLANEVLDTFYASHGDFVRCALREMLLVGPALHPPVVRQVRMILAGSG